ncbi:MAG: hypothetical protein KDK36_14755, partial [Leptospiraceae bacterium]|nr:hypothetical protein [Leptospiraceae bacterium]
MSFLEKINLKTKVILIVISFISLVVYFDKLIFGKYYFLFPNEMEWDTSPWYNFLHKTKTQEEFGFKEKGIFIVGSSVAQYSTLTGKIEELLNRTHNTNKSYKVDFYSHVAMSPTDLYYYIDDIISKKPSLVAYPLNTGDFQLDFFKIPQKESEVLTYNERDRLFLYADWRHPVRLFYPFQFLKDHYKEIDKRHVFKLLTKSLLNINRNRMFFWDPAFSYYERHYREGRSYHNYTGSVPYEGIWIKGWTKPTFTIHCELNNGNLDELIYIQKPDTEVKIYEDSKEVFSNVYKKTGWQKLFVEFKPTDSLKLLLFNTNKTVSSRE